MATNALGMKVVVRPSVNGTDLWNPWNWAGGVTANRAIPVSTDVAWQTQISRLTKGVNDWLGAVDPNSTRVRVAHFSGPVMGSLQMRPGPSNMFACMDNNGTDTLGMNWNKESHIAAWERMAHDMASPDYSELAKRSWAFDFTVLPPSARNASQLYLDTADQRRAFDALAAAHPRGQDAVIAKTESLHVDLADGCNTCAFKANPHHSQRSFAYQYVEEPASIPYRFIGEQHGRHGWENFSPLAMKSLPFNKSQVPAMYPVQQLANFSMFADLNRTAPALPSGALWAEIWRFEGVNTSSAPACDTPAALAGHLRAWDVALRVNYKRALEVHRGVQVPTSLI
jgi:hypothetical protein